MNNTKEYGEMRDYIRSLDKELAATLDTLWRNAKPIIERQNRPNNFENGLNHVKQVERNIWRLIKEKKEKFDAIELFLLSCCACCHDFDKGLFDKSLKGIDHGQKGGDFVVEESKFFFQDPNKAILIKRIIGIHNLQNEEFISKLKELDRNFILEASKINLQRLAVLLKAADILHTDSTRVDLLVINNNDLNELNKKKFLARKSITGWGLEGKNIVIQAMPTSQEELNALKECDDFITNKEWPSVKDKLADFDFPYKLRFEIDESELRAQQKENSNIKVWPKVILDKKGDSPTPIEFVKILILAANPIDTERLRLDKELYEIKKAISNSTKKFIVEQQLATTPEALRKSILSAEPNFVHFCGHGLGDKGIGLSDNNGNLKAVRTEALTGLFKLFSDKITCVFLNACYSEIQAIEIGKHIKYVIGISSEIEDNTATSFSAAFYDAIATGREGIEFAFNYGCNAIDIEDLAGKYLPILIKNGVKISHSMNKKEVKPLNSNSRRPTRFINREDELLFFKKDIENKREKNRVILLHAPSGVGKSALTSKLIEEIGNGVKFGIKVTTPQHSSEFNENSYYIRLIAKSINNKAHMSGNEDLGLNFFLKNGASKYTKERSRRLLIKMKIEEYINSSDQFIIKSLKEYIRYIIQKFSPILNIENFQNIDGYSLEFIKNLLSEKNGLYAIFEFTEDDKKGWQLDELVKELGFNNSYTVVLKRPLKKLFVKDVFNLVENITDEPIKEYLDRMYTISDGNLRPLADLEVLFDFGYDLSKYLTKNKEAGLENLTYTNLAELSDEEKYITAIIITRGGVLNSDYLKGLLTCQQFLILDIDEIILKLQKRDVIDKTETQVKIVQDRIISAYKAEKKFEKFITLAYYYWMEFYEEALDKRNLFTESISDQFVMLIICYRELYLEKKIKELLPKIGKIVLNNKFTKAEELYKNIEEMRKTIYKKGSNEKFMSELNKEIVKFYQLLGIFDEALNILEEITTIDDEYIINRARLLVLNNRHEEAITYCREEINRRDINLLPSLYFQLRLVELSALRCSNKHNECKQLFKELIDYNSLKELPEYGYLLRNAQIASLNNKESVVYMRRSIEFFNKIENSIEEVRSRIAITLELTQLHLLEEAEEHLDKAEEILKDNYAEQHSLLNNRAGIRIYKGLLNEHTLSLLLEAKSWATNNFDLLIINMNLLIFFSLKESFQETKDLTQSIERILDSNDPQDLEIRRIAYYNLYLHHKNMSQECIANNYLIQAQDIEIDFWPKQWKERLYNPNYKCDIYRFEAILPFLPTFLSYWTF